MTGLVSQHHIKKIYRGAFNYLVDKSIYAEETFEVFKDSKELTYNFNSELISRVATGELLKIATKYTVNKDMIPQRVKITKYMGKKLAKEIFQLDKKRNLLIYSFFADGETTESEINTPPIFHVGTPTAVTSALYLMSKKFEQTTDNFYTVFSSFNQWTYEREPNSNSVIVKRPSMQMENINLGGSLLEAAHYYLYQGSPGDNKDQSQSVNLYISKHMSIPYLITEKNTRIEIKYLNDLDEDR